MPRTRVIIVRHGQTHWNLKLIRQGHLDSPLTDRGIAQAKALGQRLAQENFAALYSSDLGRAVQTAEMIGTVSGHSVLTDARLRERNLGVFQGLGREEIERRFPEEYRLHRSLGPDYVIPSGESVLQQVERNLGCLSEIAATHYSGTVVVVTHGGVLSGLFRHTFSIPFTAPRRFEFMNASLNVFNYEDGAWFLQTWGDVSHLGTAGSGDGEDP
jgi:probable phosphoglycerate mutase